MWDHDTVQFYFTLIWFCGLLLQPLVCISLFCSNSGCSLGWNWLLEALAFLPSHAAILRPVPAVPGAVHAAGWLAVLGCTSPVYPCLLRDHPRSKFEFIENHHRGSSRWFFLFSFQGLQLNFTFNKHSSLSCTFSSYFLVWNNAITIFTTES